MVNLVNIIYFDEKHTDHMTERYEGILLESGSYTLHRCSWLIKQIGNDEITTRHQQIVEIVRRFERVPEE